MYPEGTLVRVVENIGDHWFALGEIIHVGRSHPNTEVWSCLFYGEPVDSKTEEERYYIGTGPWVSWKEVILVGPELSLEEMLKECLE